MPYTLLLADDSVTIQRVIELTFADEDVRVVAVGDGDQAVALLEQTPPDIVLADIGMPGRNGYEVAQYIKSTPALAHIPVLLLTGAFEPVDQERVAAAGSDGVLAKPFEPQLVISRVKELLARHAPSPQGVPAPPPAPAAAHAETWNAVLDGMMPPPGALQTPAVADIDRYFDRLDQAFADLSQAPAPAIAAAPAVPPAFLSAPGPSELDGFPIEPAAFDASDPFGPSAIDARMGTSVDLTAGASISSVGSEPAASPRAIDWFGAQTGATRATPPFDAPLVEPWAYAPPADAPGPAPAPRAVPSLVDAFTALLAAEQGMGSGVNPVNTVSPVNPASPIDTDTLVEEVTRRVLARLSDVVEPAAVERILSDTAERLVREEIARIKITAGGAGS